MSDSTTFAVCLFHPPPDDPVMKTLPPSYRLTRDQLRNACKASLGLSVTIEHYGVERASELIPDEIDHASVTKKLMESDDARDRRIGYVFDTFENPSDGGFFAVIQIAWGAMPGLRWLLRSKQIGSCSLTHTIVGDDTVVPLELSLVGVPARPGCTIRIIGTPLQCYTYKRLMTSGTISSMSESTETPKVLSPEDAIMALDENTRNLIVARMQHLAEATTKADAKAKELAQQLKEQKWVAETDMALLTGQLNQLISSMPEDARKSYSLTLEDSIADYKSADPKKILNNSLRLIMCANASSMFKASAAEDQSRKRQREEAPQEPTVVEEVMAVAPPVVAVETPAPPAAQEPSDPMSVLRAALYESFEKH